MYVGSTIKVSKKQLNDMMKVANLIDSNTNKYKIVNKMNKDLKCMKGGFIGTLLAGLAGSILPSLLSGKRLKTRRWRAS